MPSFFFPDIAKSSFKCNLRMIGITCQCATDTRQSQNKTAPFRSWLWISRRWHFSHLSNTAALLRLPVLLHLTENLTAMCFRDLEVPHCIPLNHGRTFLQYLEDITCITALHFKLVDNRICNEVVYTFWHQTDCRQWKGPLMSASRENRTVW